MFTRKALVLALALLSLGLVALADDAGSKNAETSDKSEYKKSLTRDCSNYYSATCLKLDVVSWVDKMNEEEDYSVYPGVSLVREKDGARANTADIVAELARDFPDDPDARLDAFLMKKLTSYLNSHSIKLDLFSKNGLVESARGRGGGGGGGGGGSKGGGGGGSGNGMGMMMAYGAMMKGTLMALALGGIAAIAGKALMTGLISLLLSAIIGLKALTSGGHKQTTYEIVAKPIYTSAHTHSESHEHGHGGYGHSSYGRSFDMPLPLGLQPEYNPK
ncbi:putative lysozyme-like protein [Cylas formicarius]|uniref:putative lysozyme-like protein n=1 Tax=Cylas formicarius TaxID=197179 RepID=UPI0029589038|nr:putative lysozyme-like protein [Cylas formicarius]